MRQHWRSCRDSCPSPGFDRISASKCRYVCGASSAYALTSGAFCAEFCVSSWPSSSVSSRRMVSAVPGVTSKLYRGTHRRGPCSSDAAFTMVCSHRYGLAAIPARGDNECAKLLPRDRKDDKREPGVRADPQVDRRCRGRPRNFGTSFRARLLSRRVEDAARSRLPTKRPSSSRDMPRMRLW